MTKWVTARGEVIDIRQMALSHLINALVMNVRTARCFVRNAVCDTDLWRDFVPRIHDALVKEAKRRGIEPRRWEEPPTAFPTHPTGADRYTRHRLNCMVHVAADTTDALVQTLDAIRHEIRNGEDIGGGVGTNVASHYCYNIAGHDLPTDPQAATPSGRDRRILLDDDYA